MTPGIDGAMGRSFVSRFLAERLIDGPPLGSPELHRLHGAVLLTDIEGFTAHVEGLAGHGSAGLEDLAGGFGNYFAALVDVVSARDGDVLTIAGDSLLCWWRAEGQEDLAAAALQAADAGLAIQHAIGSADGDRLNTRLGIAAGAVTIGVAGGHRGRWELVPDGPAVTQAARTERVARAGVVTVDRAVLDLLGRDVVSRPNDHGRFELVSIPVAPPAELVPKRAAASASAALAPFVPAPVSHWAATDPDWLADRRPVTVIMAKLDGDDSPAEELLQRRHLAIKSFQQVMDRFEGAAKVLFDNKGLTCSGVFGLPPRAHEDDVDRGLRAARALNEALEHLGFRCAIGVASGRAFCGLFGSDRRREYTLFGDVVNLASRLSASSSCDVLIDSATVQSSSLILELEQRPMLALKGRRDPVRVQRLVELRSPAQRSRFIVGRDRERAMIAEHVNRLIEDGERGILVIEGAAGIGKTTLADEAVALASRGGARTLRAAADPVERATPYRPWRALFTEMLGHIRSYEQLARRLSGDAEAALLLPLLNAVLPVALPETPASAALTGEARADRTDALLTGALVAASADAPLVLLVEDAQWLDSNSLALLHRVLEAVPRLLAVITERPLATGASPALEWADVRQLPKSLVLPLGPMSPADTEALVCQRLGTSTVSAQLLTAIQERAAGQPFFCEALLETMVQAGAIRMGDAGAELAGNADLTIPASIESAVLSRLDRTGPDVQLGLKAASVVGREFTAPEIAAARMAGPSDEMLAEHLEVLRGLQLIEQREARDGYGFCHQIIRDVTYELLTEIQRRPLHEGLARFYEGRLAAGERPAHPELLAHHWARAGEPERALPYLEDAGRRALRDGGFDEAVALLGEAIAVTPDSDQARRALQEKSLADAHYFRGELLRSRALLEQALERLGEPVPSGRRELAASVARDVLAQVRQLLRPRRYRGVRAGDALVLGPAVDAYRTLVQISYLHATSTLEVMHLVLAGLNLAEQVGPSPVLARALANAACMTDVARLGPIANRYAQRAVKLTEQDENSPAGAYVWNVLAIMHGQRGSWGTALSANDRALEIFGEIGDYNLEAELWQTRSALQLCRGDLSQAEVAWKRTRELAERTGSSVNLCWSLLDEAQTEIHRGQVETAAAALEAALVIPTPGSDGGTVIERHATAALVRLGQRRHAEAVSEADAVIDMASSRMPTSWVWAEFCAVAVEVMLTLREARDAEVPLAGLDRRIKRGLGALRQLTFSFKGPRVRLHLLRARAARVAGDPARGEQELVRAEREAGASDQALDRARVAIQRAELCIDPGRRAELLAPALETLSSLGALAELIRAEALLR